MDIVQDIVLSNQSIDRSAGQFHNSFARGKGIQHLLEIGCQMLGNPIVVFETGTKNLIAHTANIDTEDPINNELLKYGYLSRDTLDFLERSPDYQLVASKRFPLIYQNQELKHKRILGRVIVDKQNVACLVVWENNKPFKRQDVDLVEQLCQRVSAEMQRNGIYRNLPGVVNQRFLSDILDGKIDQAEIINKRASYMQWKLKPYYFVAVVDPRHERFFELPKIRDDVERMIPSGKTFIYDNRIVSLINTEKEYLQPDTDLKDLIKYLSNNNINAGLSIVFDNLVNLPAQFAQAVKVIELGNHLNSQKVLFSYEDYQIYHLLNFCKSDLNLIDFCHPLALKIVKYDIKSKTDYANTLYNYIKYVKDSLLTADSLFAHRNTILYRIERIKELFKIDMGDGDLLFHLYLSLKILIFLDVHNKGVPLPFRTAL